MSSDSLPSNASTAATNVSINANQLRALAERADSYRGKDMRLVKSLGGGTEPYDLIEAADDDGSRTVLLHLRTDDAAPEFTDRIEPLTLSSTPRLHLTKFPALGLDACDAVFRGLVAVEKFVLPYYARHKDAAYLKDIRDGFARNSRALALVHIPDSIESEAGGFIPMDGAAPDGDTNDPSGFYVLAPGNNLDGALRPMTLDQFVSLVRNAP